MTIARINSCPVRGNMLIPLSDHKRMITREMVESIGISYHARFREDLIQDHFPWFLLSVIFDDRIPETIAVRTFYMLRWVICSPPGVHNRARLGRTGEYTGFWRLYKIRFQGCYKTA